MCFVGLLKERFHIFDLGGNYGYKGLNEAGLSDPKHVVFGQVEVGGELH